MGNFTTQIFPSGDGGATRGAGAFANGGDKQWMTIDRGTSTGSGFQYQAWSTAGNNYAPNTFNRSPDGVLFQGPWTIPSSPIWGTLAVASDGTLYVVGTTGSGGPIYVARSTNARNVGSTPTFTVAPSTWAGHSASAVPSTVPIPPASSGSYGSEWIAPTVRAAGWVYVLATVQTPSDPMDVHVRPAAPTAARPGRARCA